MRVAGSRGVGRHVALRRADAQRDSQPDAQTDAKPGSQTDTEADASPASQVDSE